MKPQHHGVSQTTGCLVTLHRVCWPLYYRSFTAAGHQPGSGHAGHQLDIFVPGGSFDLPGQENTTLTLVLLLCFHPPYLKAWALSCYGLEHLRYESHVCCLKKILFSVCWRDGTTFMYGQIYGTRRESMVKQGNGTHPKHIQSPMRIFCLSRPRNQAQINQLWLSEIFLIQPFRWLGRIGKSLKGKKGQKGILLQCLLKTT